MKPGTNSERSSRKCIEMDLISSPKTRAELPVTFAWLADTAIAKANKLQEKVGRLRVINDLVSEAEKKAGSPQIRPGANNVEKRFVRGRLRRLRVQRISNIN